MQTESIANLELLTSMHEYNGWQEETLEEMERFVSHSTMARVECPLCNGLLHKGLIAIAEACNRDHPVKNNGKLPKTTYSQVVEWEFYVSKNKYGDTVWAVVYYDDDNFATYGWSPLYGATCYQE